MMIIFNNIPLKMTKIRKIHNIMHFSIILKIRINFWITKLIEIVILNRKITIVTLQLLNNESFKVYMISLNKMKVTLAYCHHRKMKTFK